MIDIDDFNSGTETKSKHAEDMLKGAGFQNHLLRMIFVKFQPYGSRAGLEKDLMRPMQKSPDGLCYFPSGLFYNKAAVISEDL